MTYNFMTAAEAASLIKDGEIIALSGFTPAGSPKAVTAELARQAEEKHARGELSNNPILLSNSISEDDRLRGPT